MKIVVLSDIHANLTALQKVLSDLPSYDELYCLGDLVGYGPNPNQTLQALRDQKPTLVLGGNHDSATVKGEWSGFTNHAVKAIQWTRTQLTQENLRYLKTLQPVAERKADGLEIALFHGSPRDPLNEYVFPGTPHAVLRELLRLSGARLLLQGHTHVPMSYQNSSGILLNPGSVGQPRDGDPRASYMIIDLEADNVTHKIKRVQYDIGKVAGAILDNGLPRFLAERLSLGI